MTLGESFNPLVLVAIVLAPVFIVISAYIFLRRRRRDYREFLEPPLQGRGMTFIDSTTPHGIFNVGPFPKIEFQMGRPVSNIGGIHGEYIEYKIVRFRGPKGETHELWALLEFEVFKFRRVRWRTQSKENLPPEMLDMLEN